MSTYELKDLPHLVKPVALILLILQTIFVFAPSYRSFGWFAITTTIIELVMCVVIIGVVAVNLTTIPMWPLVEMTYSGVFAVFQIINFFYFLVSMFSHFNIFLLFGVAVSAFLTLVWLFNGLQWFRMRTANSSSGNQATAAPPHHFQPNYPSGVNPA